ncbi:MAG: heavy metal translocating P-type ATPase, partial [Helicobacter sp.]|nr:heavy metal translocating P-type ATPase [Helicobacter sp.]
IGIAMGKTGSDIALERADIVLLNDDLRKISRCLAISKKTRKILWENIILALGVKFAIMILGAFGFANLWIALFGDVGVAILALLNAIRAIK